MSPAKGKTRRPILPPPPPASAAWAYFIDLDGTLVDIADAPDAIAVDARLRQLLGELERVCGGAVAVVSGRALADLERHLAPMRLAAAGQHGLERRDAAGRLTTRAIDADIAAGLRDKLAPLVGRHPDLLLEDKRLSLALHYRRQPRLASYLHRLMRQYAAASHGRIVLQRGKRVIEAKPAGIDKGTAIAEFLVEAPFRGRRPVFIGDDVTDEHGFAIVNAAQGLSIKVGAGATAARHRLPDVAAVLAWLSTTFEEPT